MNDAVGLVVGTVVSDSPLTVSIDGGAAAATKQAGTWTPTVGMRVVVAVNAQTRARLYAIGPIS